MTKPKTVDDIISTWTPEERETFKDLIGECRLREKTITENTRLSLDGLKRLADEMVGELVDCLYSDKYTMKC